MTQNNLYKGFEVELFTGSLNSHIGVSAEIEKKFSDFVKEPDNRNVEYITTPEKDYSFLYEKLITPRKKLRRWLNKKELTIIPSSTLCFKHDIQFQRSDINNVYHQFIQDNYGTSIATSSVHINLGINDLDKLFAAIRLIRSEAALYLSLSASSPFLNNKALTIIPSSTLCFSHDIQFQRSDIDNVYHQFIQDNYGISIATSSVHINIGIDNLDKLFSAIRLIRSVL